MSTSILLSTYNGELYLREQLDSLFAQTDQDWRLIVRDDGSKDGTISILEEYQHRYQDRIELLPSNGNLGPIQSFGKLLEYCDSDYIFFCDQDDVWLPEKIASTRALMLEEERKNEGKPIAVFTDLKVVDHELNLIHSSFWEYSKIHPDVLKDFDMLCVHGVATGCTMMINRKSKEVSMPFTDVVRMHDAWIILCTLKAGGAINHLSESTILYRQHSKNVVGAIDESNSYVSSRLKDIKRVWNNNYAQWKMVRSLGFKSITKYVWLKLKYHYR